MSTNPIIPDIELEPDEIVTEDTLEELSNGGDGEEVADE